jgi:alpha-tubulin suppressor-like RCC1 family protein
MKPRFVLVGALGLVLGALLVVLGTVSPSGVSAQGPATATPIPPEPDYSNPTSVAPLKNVIAISAEHEDTCALLDNGIVECWGAGAYAGSQNVLGIKNAIAISSGGQHSCALLEDGTVMCWGYNSDGQLGDGTTDTAFDEAVAVKGLPNASAIGLGWSFSCAIADGEVWCWGENDSGQLGNGSMEPRMLPVKVMGLGGKAVSIIAGSSHACALLEGGRVQCWGRGLQIDDGLLDRTLPVDIPGLSSDVTFIASEYWHTCAVKSNGQVFCWGDNEYGQLGDGTTSDAGSPVAVQGLSGTITIVTTGYKHTCAANTAGEVFCWGDNRAGQLGNRANNDSTNPVKVAGLDGPAEGLSAGDDFSCALVASGVQCWGENGGHELGTGVDPNSEVPTNVAGLDGATSIAAGGDASCVITPVGVRCWGENENGQVGDGTDIDRDAPVAVTGLPGNVTGLAVGYNHSCALVSNSVWCWGAGYSGQLANGGRSSLIPVSATGLPPEIRGISAGGNSTCVLAGDGNLWCWGNNDNGQLGDGTDENRESPVQVQGLNGRVTSFSVGVDYACAVVNNGVFCWGNNNYRQLGDGTDEDRLTPVAVSGLGSGIASVIAGEKHSCAITTSGAVKCWGYNLNGQLGDGTNDERLAPVDVIGLSNKVAAMGIGIDFTCALTETGGVKCWGSDSKIGNDTISYGESYSPVDVLGLTNNAVAIAVGRFHACAVLTDGSAKCWGTNWNGQLGNGAGPDSNEPVTVVLGDRQYARDEPTNAFRTAGPLVPEITTYIPTPLDVSPAPGVIGTNLLLAALMMLPFAVAAELFTRTLSENEETLRRRIRPVDWLSRLQAKLESFAGTKLERRPAVRDALKMIGIMVFYGLVFSLLDRTWNPFSLKGLILFLSMTLAYGLVGIADDFLQWRRIRKWGLSADLTIRPTNVLLALGSTATSRLLTLIPGLMFGTPEALQTDESQFDEPKRTSLLKISAVTFTVIGLGVWLPTAILSLIQRASLSGTLNNLLGGLEAFLLVIFAVTLENLFVQMLGLPGSIGQAIKRRSRFAWLAAMLGVGFLFYHTLINPRGELADALRESNVWVLFGVGITFVLLTFGLRSYFARRTRAETKPAASSHPQPVPVQVAVPAPKADASAPAAIPVEPPASETLPADSRACPHCGQVIKRAARLCRHCRKPVTPLDDSAPAVAPAIPPAPEIPADSKQCPKCKNIIKLEARLCRFCRTSFHVKVTGYCAKCQATVDVNESGRCSRCRGEIVDRHVISTLIS